MTLEMWGLLSSAILFAAVVVGWQMIVPAWSSIAQNYVSDLSSRLLDLNVDRTKLDLYLRIWGASFLVAFFGTWLLLGMPLVAAALLFPIYVAPRYVLEFLVEQRKIKLRDQLVAALTLLANAARANMSFPEAIAMAGGELPEPMRSEFRRISADYERGKTLRAAIEDTDQRLKLASFTLFASAILVSLDRGGQITHALERIGRSLQENQRLERKLEAETQAGKKVVMILLAFPVLFVAGFYLLDPDATGLLFSTLLGQGILIGVGAMMYLSAKWTMSILKLDI